MMSNIIKQEFETIIGLEVHLQLNTKTKIFCGCANEFGQPPNSRTCPVCLGLPGTLPVLNKTALEHAVKVALALNCKINPFIKFDRKNYYYPDLPKGYQISQYDLPIASDGFLIISSNQSEKKIRIKRAHLEEDAGKLIHDTDLGCSLVDYNRTGTPLIEIVTEPDLRSPQETYDYLTALKLLLQYLNVSDCDMEKGSLRCDANISIRQAGSKKLGTKAEVKNMNSFRAVKSALEFEVNRQTAAVNAGETIIQETRLWNEEKQATFAMRSKEEAHDYRYFPEPDLVPFTLEEKIIQEIQSSIPELPDAKLKRIISDYSLPEYDARIIIQDQALADFFEKCTTLSKDIKKISNWIIGPLLQEIKLRKTPFTEIPLSVDYFVSLINEVEGGSISNLVGKEILPELINTGKDPKTIIQEKGLAQVSDLSELEKIVDDIIEEHDKVVSQIKEGKNSAMGFLVGQAMKKSQGKANPKLINDLFKRRLQQ